MRPSSSKVITSMMSTTSASSPMWLMARIGSAAHGSATRTGPVLGGRIGGEARQDAVDVAGGVAVHVAVDGGAGLLGRGHGGGGYPSLRCRRPSVDSPRGRPEIPPTSAHVDLGLRGVTA